MRKQVKDKIVLLALGLVLTLALGFVLAPIHAMGIALLVAAAKGVWDSIKARDHLELTGAVYLLIGSIIGILPVLAWIAFS